MSTKVYKEYSSFFSSKTSDQPIASQSEKTLVKTYEIIPYKPPENHTSSVTTFIHYHPAPPETLIIPFNRSRVDSPPRKTVRKSYKCETFTMEE